MQKVLSLIIPTYNMERYLPKCLDSLILGDEEMMKQLEVLVINDGSKDRSSAIAHRYQSRFPHTFRVIDKENGNYGSCINRGLKEAQGKYIKVLDADDSFDNEGFKGLLEFLKYSEADCIISKTARITEDDSLKSIIDYQLPTDRLFGIKELGAASDNMWMHCVCYLTENLRSIDYRQTEGISYTDQEWICRPMAIARHIAYYPHIVYRYLDGREGQTVDPSVWDKNFWQEIQGTRVLIEEHSKPHPLITPEGIDYIKQRIQNRVRTLYNAYLTLFDSHSNNERMKEFDLYLKAYDSELYRKQDDLTILKSLHFVRHWRKDYNPDTLYLRLVHFLSNYIRKKKERNLKI